MTDRPRIKLPCAEHRGQPAGACTECRARAEGRRLAGRALAAFRQALEGQRPAGPAAP